jgi:hypothetical protein
MAACVLELRPSAPDATLHKRMDDAATLQRIREALLDEAFSGIERTAQVYAFGAFQLSGALLDTVGGLASPRGTQAARFEAFIKDYFPPAYAAGELPKQLYDGLRCRPLHNYSTIDLLLMEGQDEAYHLTAPDGRTVIRLQNLLEDLNVALDRWWQDVETDPARRAAALTRQAQHPVVRVEAVPNVPPATVTAYQFVTGATAYSGAFASGAVRQQ